MTKSYYYAMADMGVGKTMGGKILKEVIARKLKCFIAISLYMGMKKQPNLRSYWPKKGSIFFCPTISSLMICGQFESI